MASHEEKEEEEVKEEEVEVTEEEEVRARIAGVTRFLSVALRVANAHTVQFFTHDVWRRLVAVPPEEVLAAVGDVGDGRQGEPRRHPESETLGETAFGFCEETGRLVDVHALLAAARGHSLPGLGASVSRERLLRSLRAGSHAAAAAAAPPHAEPGEPDAEPAAGEFMNSKKSHEVRCMSEVVSRLAQACRVKQVIDVGSGKGYLCSFLSLRYGLQVYGIDSSSTNTHGAQERNRKLKRFSRAYQTHLRGQTHLGGQTQWELPGSGAAAAAGAASQAETGNHGDKTEGEGFAAGDLPADAAQGETTARLKKEEEDEEEEEDESASLSESTALLLDIGSTAGGDADPRTPENQQEEVDPFLGALPLEAIEETAGARAAHRASPGELGAEERERRKRDNLARKARRAGDGGGGGGPGRGAALYSPLTSYVTAETELRELIDELQDAVMVGLHTCGDLAPSTLRMFVAKRELASVCSVGCCYHLLSEEFDPAAPPGGGGVFGFPMSAYLRERSWFCGRNARMSACLALERVTVGQGIQMESLFFRAVLHVILRDHFDSFKSERRVGNVYSKSKSFVDYVRKALGRLGLDDTKLSDSVIQGYHDAYTPRMAEMRAFNMLKVILAPCIEGVVLLDRLCYLKEQEDVAFSALVQLFDPVLSPRCYAVVGVKTPGDLN